MPIGLAANSLGYTSQPVGSTVSALNPTYTPPSAIVPPISPIAASPLAALGEAALGLLAPVAAGVAAFFFNPSPAGDVNESKAVQNLNTGPRKVSTAPPYVPPFTGGQSVGVAYQWKQRYITTYAGGYQTTYEDSTPARHTTGALLGVRVDYYSDDGSYRRAKTIVETSHGDCQMSDLSIRSSTIITPSIFDVTRVDGLADPANLPNPNPAPEKSVPSGYDGNNGRDPNQKKILPPNLSSAVGWGNSKPIPSNVVRAALGFGKELPIKNLSPSTSPNSTPLKSPSQTPLQNPPNKSPLQKPTDPLEKEKTPPFDPTKPYTPGSNDLTGQIASLGAILGTIKANTSPENQQLNAKTGSCDAMKSPSCTKDFEDRIKNPLSDKLDVAQVARDAKSVSDIAQFAAITDNFTKVKNFLNNTIVDRALGAANFAMNVHNALMLSNALGKTLATVVDTALNFTGFKFYDANTGNATTASRAFNQNVSSIIVNLIGQDQYTELTNEWKVANRIYQSSTSLLNKTERLLGAQSKVAQKGNIDVANIGNALLVNGTVNPNSYPPMAATKEANTPPDLMSDASSPLSSFAGQVRNLNTITKSVNSTLRNVSGIQKDFGKLADLTNSESKVRKSIRSQSASQAKIKAKFTFLQIKQIKVTGKK